MSIRLINIGYGNIVVADRVIAVITPESAPIRRMIQDAKESAKLIDATCGRKTRGVIVTDNGCVVLSAIQPETIAARFSFPKELKTEKSE
jgi:regulator of extracellular matrix RemA (YlzA/DUF370 family)